MRAAGSRRGLRGQWTWIGLSLSARWPMPTEDTRLLSLSSLLHQRRGTLADLLNRNFETAKLIEA